MELKKVTQSLSVGGQITVADLLKIAEAGFRAIICNRPDGESGDQPTFAELAEAAKAHEIEMRHVPVAPGKACDADGRAFATAMAELPTPVAAYCRTGMRSVMLWSMAQKGSLPPSDILAAAKSVGFDMSGIVRGKANIGAAIRALFGAAPRPQTGAASQSNTQT